MDKQGLDDNGPPINYTFRSQKPPLAAPPFALSRLLVLDGRRAARLDVQAPAEKH